MSFKMVAAVGLEPTNLTASDFKSLVFTNFTTQPLENLSVGKTIYL